MKWSNLKSIALLFILIFFSLAEANSQLLDIKDAISLGLKNNFDIQLSANDAQISKVNNTAGNAGMLPGLNLNAGLSTGINNSHLEYATGSVIDNPSARLLNYSAGLALNWTLFDGFKMFTTSRKLEDLEKAGDLKYRNQIQQTVLQIITSYYDIVRQKQLLRVNREAMNLSQERRTISETKFNAGLAPKTELLQAQIDYNNQYQNEILQKNNIAELKRKLNLLLVRKESENFEVADDIPESITDTINTEQKIYANNPFIQSLSKAVEAAQEAIGEQQSLNYPYITLNAAYNTALADNSGSQVRVNKSIGPTIGAALTFPLYLGGNISRLTEIAQINLNSVQLQLESAKLSAMLQYNNALSQMKVYTGLLETEQKTKELAKENLSLAMERLRLSQTTAIELKDAELSYENSLTRLVNIKYNLKIAESQIKMLKGEL